MARDWEATFRAWSARSSDTEDEKRENAERRISEAIRGCGALAQRGIRVFAQGSYRNNTNVRQESDVDICALYSGAYFYHLAQGLEDEPSRAGRPSDYSYREYKADVEAGLVAKFGRERVTRGNKAIDVSEGAYALEADVVAAFDYRYYWKHSSGAWRYRTGIAFSPDKGGLVFNYPDQHYENGVIKNNATARRFKRIVRILKRLRHEMEDNDIDSAKPIASYLIECLVYNVPNDHLNNAAYISDVRRVLAYIFNNTRTVDECKEWVEVNGFKYLFRTSQGWTREQAHAFISAAWDYVGFK